MRSLPVLLFGLLASAAAAAPVEEGYPSGALGLAAIAASDWATAERQLTATDQANDPARLINLGEVYYRTGRRDEAYRMWEAAAAAPKPFLVTTRDGRVVSTAALARQALGRRMLASR